MAVVPSPGVRVAVAESLIRDLGRVGEWCDLLGMKLNASKTKTMVVSRGSVPGSRVILTSIFIQGFLSNPGKSREIIFHCLCIVFN